MEVIKKYYILVAIAITCLLPLNAFAKPPLNSMSMSVSFPRNILLKKSEKTK